MQVSALGAIVGLVIAIVLILRKTPPAYGMLCGAFFGGLIGGADLVNTVDLMIKGAQGITTAVMRILAAGVLAGVLIESGAAHSIAETIVKKVGETRALMALALATMLLTAVGVFVDVAVITVAPIALAIAQKGGISKLAILLAMIGGGKAGNIMSPNPQAIALSDAFNQPLTTLMVAGIIPAIFGILITYLLARSLVKKGAKVEAAEVQSLKGDLPEFKMALVAPVVAIILLALRPIAGIKIDPLIALPVGGFCGVLAMKKFSSFNNFAVSGLNKMMPVAVMLLGTGALAGIIGNSGLKDVLISALQGLGLPSFILAPASAILMSMATASTTAGAVTASQVFGGTLSELGVGALSSAAMIHAGATVLDHMPHGSFFHATGGSIGMDIKERLKLIPYETLVGLVLTIVSTLIFGVFA